VTTLSVPPTPQLPAPPSDEWRAHLGTLLARLAIGFVHLSPHEVDAALTAALGELGSFVGADRASLWLTLADRKQLDVTHEWQADGVAPLDDKRRSVSIEQHVWSIGVLRDGGAIGSRVAELSTEHAIERDWLAKDGVQSVIMLPLRVADRLLGVARFDSTRRRVPWPLDAHELLRPFGDLCASAIAAQRALAGLEASELRHRSVLDEVTDVIVRIRPDGTLGYVNRAWYELTGNPVADTVGADSMANVHPDDRALAMEHMAAALSGFVSPSLPRFPYR